MFLGNKLKISWFINSGWKSSFYLSLWLYPHHSGQKDQISTAWYELKMSSFLSFPRKTPETRCIRNPLGWATWLPRSSTLVPPMYFSNGRYMGCIHEAVCWDLAKSVCSASKLKNRKRSYYKKWRWEIIKFSSILQLAIRTHTTNTVLGCSVCSKVVQLLNQGNISRKHLWLASDIMLRLGLQF